MASKLSEKAAKYRKRIKSWRFKQVIKAQYGVKIRFVDEEETKFYLIDNGTYNLLPYVCSVVHFRIEDSFGQMIKRFYIHVHLNDAAIEVLCGSSRGESSDRLFSDLYQEYQIYDLRYQLTAGGINLVTGELYTEA